jgi:hypothetical protein
LRFFTSLEEVDQQNKLSALTSEEKNKIKQMREWERLRKIA